MGTIDLEPTKDDKFDLWSGCAAGARLTAEARLYANELDRKLAEQTENNSKLEEQLQELLRAKEEHEDALLHKFTELLNAKKLKIRDQQRLLSTAKADIVKGKLCGVRSAVLVADGFSPQQRKRRVWIHDGLNHPEVPSARSPPKHRSFPRTKSHPMASKVSKMTTSK